MSHSWTATSATIRPDASDPLLLPDLPPDMPAWFPDAIIAVLCAASAVVWFTMLGRRPASVGEPHPPADPNVVAAPQPAVPIVPPGAIIFAGLWVLYHLVGDLAAVVEGSEPPLFDAQRTLRALQQNCGILGAGTAVAWMLLTRGEPSRFREFGLRRRNLAGQIGDGLLTVTAAWLPVFATLLITMPLRTADRRHSVFQLLDVDASPVIYAWAVLAAVVVAPLFEELVFRVILQTWLERYLGRFALPVAAVLFAAVHRFPDSLAIVPLALVLGAAYRARRSYTEIVTAHALFNAVMLALDAAMPDQ